MKIFKPYEDEKPEVRCNCCGNIMEPEYKERYDENGHPYLEKVGEVNTYEKMQQATKAHSQRRVTTSTPRSCRKPTPNI